MSAARFRGLYPEWVVKFQLFDARGQCREVALLLPTGAEDAVCKRTLGWRRTMADSCSKGAGETSLESVAHAGPNKDRPLAGSRQSASIVRCNSAGSDAAERVERLVLGSFGPVESCFRNRVATLRLREQRFGPAIQFSTRA